MKQLVGGCQVDDIRQREVHERISGDVGYEVFSVRLQEDVQLWEVRFEGDLAQPGEQVDVADTECRPEVPRNDVDDDRHPRCVRVYSVVRVLLPRKNEHRPDAEDCQEDGEDSELDEVAAADDAEPATGVELTLEELDEALPVRVVVGAQHADEAHPVVESSAEQPLVQVVYRVVGQSQDKGQWSEGQPSHTGYVEDDGIDDSVDDQLDGHPQAVLVPGTEHAHYCVDRQEPVSMHGADVVDHVGVGHGQTDDGNEEIQSKQHLGRPPQREIFAHPEKREIACTKKRNRCLNNAWAFTFPL